MNQLSQRAFSQAVRFIEESARPVDKALFQFFFDEAPAENVRIELSRFQKDDGGFGGALEPDLRAPTSSPLVTAIALQILADVDAPPDSSMVGRAVDYLISSYRDDLAAWIPVSADANDYPHAPWWHDEDGSLAKAFEGFRIIPRAHIVGLFHHFSGLVPVGWLDAMTESAVKYIENVDPLGTGGGDDLRYALHLAEARGLPEKYKARLSHRIHDVVPKVIERDPQGWSSYGITPLKVAPSPDSVAANLIWDEVQLYLDYLIDGQESDGSWGPTWSWGGQYPGAWEQAKIEWQGQITVETLRSLSDYGRIKF